MTPCVGDTIRLTRGGPLKRVTLVAKDLPGEWDRPTPQWAAGELLRIEVDVLDPTTGKKVGIAGYSRLEPAPSGNLREQSDLPPDHWAYIGEIFVVDRPKMKQVDLFNHSTPINRRHDHRQQRKAP